MILFRILRIYTQLLTYAQENKIEGVSALHSELYLSNIEIFLFKKYTHLYLIARERK